MFYDPGYKNKVQKKKELRVSLRFCPTAEIRKQFEKGLYSKCQFLVKIEHLKNSGQKLTVVHKCHEWIQDNIDVLFNDPKLKKCFLKKTKIDRKNNDYHLKLQFMELMNEFVTHAIEERRGRCYKKKIENLKSRYEKCTEEDFLLKS